MLQQFVTGARRQKAIIERQEPSGWLVMYENGDVEEWDTASHALRSVQKRANRGNKTVTITTIEWRNVPEGWQPPTGEMK